MKNHDTFTIDLQFDQDRLAAHLAILGKGLLESTRTIYTYKDLFHAIGAVKKIIFFQIRHDGFGNRIL